MLKYIGALFLVLVVSQSVFAQTNSITVSGRNWFRMDEPIYIHLPSKSKNVEVSATSGSEKWTFSGKSINEAAVFTIVPFVLSSGEWTISTTEATGKINIVAIEPQTPFSFNVYQGSLDDGTPAFYEENMKGDARADKFKGILGINHMMLQNSGNPLTVPVVDLLTRHGIRFSTQYYVAGQHQPEGLGTDWSIPEVVTSSRLRTKLGVHYLRFYKGFTGMHYADEPGLAYGYVKTDGSMEPYQRNVPGPEGAILTPLGIGAQYEEYTKATGKPAPKPFEPQANLESWMDFNRWRLSILGNAFATFTKDVHEIDPQLIGFSQIYAWAYTSDGEYPPLNGLGVDILATHAYTDNSIGLWYPLHETDAMRSGAWNKPLWMMPVWSGMQPHEGDVRALIYGTVARKVEGITWPLDWALDWPEAKEVTEKLLPISGMLTDLKKSRDQVGIFYSKDQSIYSWVKNPKDHFSNRDYVGRVMGAWLMCQAIQTPGTWLVEEELLGKNVPSHKVLLVPNLTYARPEVKDALEKYAQSHLVLLDASSTLEIKGAQKMGFAFSDVWHGYQASAPGGIVGTDAKRFQELILKNLPEFKKAVGAKVSPLVETTEPTLMASEQITSGGRYLWLVNMNHENRDKPLPLTTKVQLPLTNGFYYDVFAGKKLAGNSLDLNLKPGDAMLLMESSKELQKVQLSKPKWTAPFLQVSATIGEKGGSVPTIPVILNITTPDNHTLTYFRSIKNLGDGLGFSEKFGLGSTAHGKYKVSIKNVITGESDALEITIDKTKPKLAQWDQVLKFDEDHLSRMVQKGQKEILVLYGDETEKLLAQEIANSLIKRGRKARVDAAKNQMKDRPIKINIVWLHWTKFQDINQPVVLVGTAKTNSLIDLLAVKMGISPLPVANNFPAPGHGALYWANGVFGLEDDIAVVMASEPIGLAAAGEEFKKLVGGSQSNQSDKKLSSAKSKSQR
ncbi:MAG: hypothetical protein SGI71_09700 [Verrucomicrobiota bacterium]|nr:hypothetical protein [Verrucomicrobiota bacterium]